MEKTMDELSGWRDGKSWM